MALKFEDCRDCIWRKRKDICANCDYGELFEDQEMMGFDKVFREAPKRFGESVSPDDDPTTVDPDRFADEFEDEDEGNEV